MYIFEYSNAQIEKMIYDKLPELSKGEKAVAYYILGNFSVAAHMSSLEIAEQTGVSDTTVVRFAKAMGFKGYMEFKKMLKDSVYTSTGMYETLRKMDVNSDNEYMANYMLSAISDLESFAQTIDYNQISKIAQALLDAEYVYVGGLGTDVTFSAFLHSYLRKIGFHVIVLNEEGSSMREQMLNITNRDALIMCSFPVLMLSETDMAHRAKKAGAKLITVTNSEIDAITLNGDYRIIITDQKKTFFNSYITPMAFCNILLLKITELAPQRVEEGLKRYKDLVRD